MNEQNLKLDDNFGLKIYKLQIVKIQQNTKNLFKNYTKLLYRMNNKMRKQFYNSI